LGASSWRFRRGKKTGKVNLSVMGGEGGGVCNDNGAKEKKLIYNSLLPPRGPRMKARKLFYSPSKGERQARGTSVRRGGGGKEKA